MKWTELSSSMASSEGRTPLGDHRDQCRKASLLRAHCSYYLNHGRVKDIADHLLIVIIDPHQRNVLPAVRTGDSYAEGFEWSSAISTLFGMEGDEPQKRLHTAGPARAGSGPDPHRPTQMVPFRRRLSRWR